MERRLFGAYAREDPDVDVLVVVDGLTDLEIGLVAGEAARIIQRTTDDPVQSADIQLDLGRTCSARSSR